MMTPFHPLQGTFFSNVSSTIHKPSWEVLQVLPCHNLTGPFLNQNANRWPKETANTARSQKIDLKLSDQEKRTSTLEEKQTERTTTQI